jgi:hypothetical protein
VEETKQITLTASGKVATLRGYMTGAIDMELRTILAKANKTKYEVGMDSIQAAAADPNSEGGVPKDAKVVMETDPTVQIDADKRAIERMVLILDGSDADILNRVLELPAMDTAQLITEINLIKSGGEKLDAEKKAV